MYKVSSLSDRYPSTSRKLTGGCAMIFRSPRPASLWPCRSPRRAKISIFRSDAVCQSSAFTQANLFRGTNQSSTAVAESRLQTRGRSTGSFLARRPLIAVPAKLTSHPAPVDQNGEGHRARPAHPSSTDYESAVDRNGAVGRSEGGWWAHRSQGSAGAYPQRHAHSCPFLTRLSHPDI